MLMTLLPSPGSRRFDQVLREIDEFIFGLIREGRRSGQDQGDLLSMLLLARDESGTGMSDRQLRDELVTLMVAGLDTTALAVSWALFLLARHPEAQLRLKAEVDQVLGERSPTFAELPQLRFADAVLKESMRLYPPAWLIGREAMNDCEVGGQSIKRGESIILSQWLVHRDLRHFPDAAAFRPERWLEASISDLPKFAYFPFGGGPRVCIGNNFAVMEGILVLAAIFQRFGVRCESGYTVKPWPSITLQPEGGIWLELR